MTNIEIQQLISKEKELLPYNTTNATFTIKDCIYQAFLELSKEDSFIDYLVHHKRGLNIQSKLFQITIKHLENKLPFSFLKKKKLYTITSLLDDNLGFFEGISIFHSVVNDNHIITNGTKEMFYAEKTVKPFFLGKLLTLTDLNNHSLINDIDYYDFNKIVLKTTKPKTSVIVSHLRIPPHYQMGLMSHINRIRAELKGKIDVIQQVSYFQT